MRVVNFIGENDIQLLHCGADYFPALIAAFDAARVEIYLETYIFADDETARAIKQALVRAAARGVAVNLVTDWVGTGNLSSKALQRECDAAGIMYRSFNPWFVRGIARMHRKLCVVDRQVAFLGGLNIVDDMHDDDDPRIMLPAPRWDFGVRITGLLVASIHWEMALYWARMGNLSWRTRWATFREQRRRRRYADAGRPMVAGLVVRDNLRNRRTIQTAYLKALGGARHAALLANPYFAPGRRMRNGLVAAARRGVAVTLLLGVGQYRFQDVIARSYYPKLLKCGVRIVEYRKTQLHGKVAVVDDRWATVGSSNYDGFSLFVNQEANVVVLDQAFAQTLRAHIEDGIAEGVEVTLEEFAGVPWYRKAFHRVAYLIYASVLRLITWGKSAE
ncbi:phospholipase D-like domain-containing protein [Oxalicibacterium solurbis]|uniref:Cardiolipin synthase B n=1 Tax=Oxalicibacterium solurbis TaxID=69280 RepID=A0A8J3F555_9BURK|nr:phospholipase D-like domain-containing protein [Oxalicibacterium solurbis]GGI53704.1 cardiolipin synthase B [Oxalicibacterium solurbis]